MLWLHTRSAAYTRRCWIHCKTDVLLSKSLDRVTHKQAHVGRKKSPLPVISTPTLKRRRARARCTCMQREPHQACLISTSSAFAAHHFVLSLASKDAKDVPRRKLRLGGLGRPRRSQGVRQPQPPARAVLLAAIDGSR